MSFNVRWSGKARDVEAHLELAGANAKAGRNGFEEKAIDLIVTAGVASMKHASIDPGKEAEVHGWGHFAEDGTGDFSMTSKIWQPVPSLVGPDDSVGGEGVPNTTVADEARMTEQLEDLGHTGRAPA